MNTSLLRSGAVSLRRPCEPLRASSTCYSLPQGLGWCIVAEVAACKSRKTGHGRGTRSGASCLRASGCAGRPWAQGFPAWGPGMLDAAGDQKLPACKCLHQGPCLGPWSPTEHPALPHRLAVLSPALRRAPLGPPGLHAMSSPATQGPGPEVRGLWALAVDPGRETTRAWRHQWAVEVTGAVAG